MTFHPRVLPPRHRLPWLAAPLALLALSLPLARARAASAASVSVTATVMPARPFAALPQPRLVELTLGNGLDMDRIAAAGVDVLERAGDHVRALEWPGDEARFMRLGVVPVLLDASPGATAARRSHADQTARPAPRPSAVLSATGADGVFRIQSLPPFGSGSMGGFWTSAEIKMKLDQLVANDTHGLVADKIDTVGWSREGRPIWGLKIAKAVGGADTRPVAFYNALTHAREPEGMQTIFWFVDDLIAKYGTDPLATFILEHRVIYIVPLVNPDGYAVNEQTYNGSGGSTFGLWRKNTRDNNANGVFDGSDGVDLNRNFGVNWGYDNTGSSPDSSADTYRGPAAWSESETRAQRDLVAALKPVTGISIHTYGDLMIHAWGPTTTPPQSAAAFAEWSDELTRDNAYLSGPAPHVLYSVNGDFNDYCYGDTILKPRAFTWSPEVGGDSDGFWAPPSRIVPLAQEMLRPCYLVAAYAGPYLVADGVTIVEGAMNAGRLATLLVGARHQGAAGTSGTITGTLTALDAGAHVLNGTATYPAAATRTTVAANGGAGFQVALDDSVTPGRLMRFQIDFTSASGFGRDTLVIPAGTPTVLYADGASNGTTGWSISPSTSWSVVANDLDHPSRYFAEQGINNYQPAANDRFILKSRLNLAAGVHAYAFYDAKWEYEQDYDAGTVEASFDSTTWTTVRATGSTPGSGLSSQQVAGRWLYCGNRRRWGSEIADLSSFAGAGRTRVNLRFRGLADGAGNFDGLAFDSLRIVIYDPAAQPAPVAVAPGVVPATLALAAPWPNPAHDRARFEFALPRAGHVQLDVLDVAGRHVRTLADHTLAAGRYAGGWDLRDEPGAPVAPGVYLVRLATAGSTLVRRIAVLH